MVGELETVRAAVAFVCDRDPESLRADTRLDEIGADSLVRVAVADAVEQRLLAVVDGWRIDDATLAAVATVGELADAVARCRAEAGTPLGAVPPG